MKILGIDPGAVSGGCAVVEINNGATPQLIEPSTFLLSASKQNSASMSWRCAHGFKTTGLMP
jgi:hypothetical protein